ncbi:MAG: RNA polymerase sigma factor [Chromatiales bacterium]|nr:RNA polymerase sigma factor [Chromatiales bacterium]
MADFSQLITQHIPRLRRYAKALFSDPALAEDLVQDCLERAWSKQHLWNGSGDIRAWLFSIMHNLHANEARKFNRRPALIPMEAQNDQPITGNQESTLALNELEAALHNLPEKQREVLLLVGLEQMSYEEAADVLNVPTGTVMSRLSRARENLRSTLYGAHKQSNIRRIK